MSFTVSRMQNKSSNCWAFCLSCEDRREFQYQLKEVGPNLFPPFEVKYVETVSFSNYTTNSLF